jgi:hypothetical protein
MLAEDAHVGLVTGRKRPGVCFVFEYQALPIDGRAAVFNCLIQIDLIDRLRPSLAMRNTFYLSGIPAYSLPMGHSRRLEGGYAQGSVHPGSVE